MKIKGIFFVLFFSLFLFSCNKNTNIGIDPNNIISKNIESPFFGDPRAKIQLILFSDFQCPACIIFEKNIGEKLMSDYAKTNKIGLTFKNFTLSQHQNAPLDALAAMCAHSQNKFEDFSKKIFNLEEQKNGELVTFLERENLATEIGLNLEQFKKCVSEGNYIAKIQEDKTLGENMGLRGTPSVYVNGKLMKFGSKEGFFKILDQLIK